MSKDTINKSEVDQSLRLDAQLSFGLHATARAITKAYMDILREKNLTYPQYLVLIVLFEEDGLSVSEIGNRLHLDSGTLTPLIKRMEKDKIVTRRRSVDDERVVLVSLTDKGQGLRDVARRAREGVVDRLDMTDDEIIAMRNQLMEITHKLSRK